MDYLIESMSTSFVTNPTSNSHHTTHTHTKYDHEHDISFDFPSLISSEKLEDL